VIAYSHFTCEKIAEATQLYIFADKLPGPKTAIVRPGAVPPPETFNQIQCRNFGDALIDFENLVPDLDLLPRKGVEFPSSVGYSALYFCIPPSHHCHCRYNVSYCAT